MFHTVDGSRPPPDGSGRHSIPELLEHSPDEDYCQRGELDMVEPTARHPDLGRSRSTLRYSAKARNARFPASTIATSWPVGTPAYPPPMLIPCDAPLAEVEPDGYRVALSRFGHRAVSVSSQAASMCSSA
jgi:hypothetical protein